MRRLPVVSLLLAGFLGGCDPSLLATLLNQSTSKATPGPTNPGGGTSNPGGPSNLEIDAYLAFGSWAIHRASSYVTLWWASDRSVAVSMWTESNGFWYWLHDGMVETVYSIGITEPGSMYDRPWEKVISPPSASLAPGTAEIENLKLVFDGSNLVVTFLEKPGGVLTFRSSSQTLTFRTSDGSAKDFSPG